MIGEKLLVACIQVNTRNQLTENVLTVSSLIREAAGCGAQLVLMPENVIVLMTGQGVNSESWQTTLHNLSIEVLSLFRSLAMELRLWLHCGSLMAQRGSNGDIVNRSYVLRPDGVVAAYYDKIHMFDVTLGDGKAYLESSIFTPGHQAVVVNTPWGGLGLSICYDLRFPQLYRTLAQSGAIFLAIPAAFTLETGTAHWEILLRARAIETGSYVFAPNQTGTQSNDYQTYGHSLIIGPWGEVLADAGTKAGFIVTEVDPLQVWQARKKIPSLYQENHFSCKAL